MMGPRQVAQGGLFYEFSIEDHLPPDHLLREVDRFVDLGDLRRYLAPFYSSTGRPSVDPELMIRMLIVGYAFGIRSERRLCKAVHLDLAYRWFCRLDLTDAVPDHSTFSKNRHGRFRDSNLFRHLFKQVLERCIAEGLVGGESFGADASLIKADASRYTKVGFAEWSAADAANRATQEYLDTLDDANFGAVTPVKPKAISPADPAARLTGANGDRPFFAYSTNYPVDLDHAIIVDIEATAPIRQAEVTAHLGDPVQLAGHADTRKRGIDHGRQTFPAEVVDDAEDAEPPAVRERIRHEVERPPLVRPLRDRHGRPGPDRTLASTPFTNG